MNQHKLMSDTTTMNEITVNTACRLKNLLDEANLSGLSAKERLDVAELHGRLIEVHAKARRAIRQLQREYVETTDDGAPLRDDTGDVVYTDEEAWAEEVMAIHEEEVTIEPLPAHCWQGWPNELVALLRPVLRA